MDLNKTTASGSYMSLIDNIGNIVTLLDLIRSSNCSIGLFQSDQKETQIDFTKLKADFLFQRLNKTHFIAKEKSNLKKNYFVSISSILNCIVSNLAEEFLDKNLPHKQKHEHVTTNSSHANYFLRPEIQPVLYVSVLLSVFTVIFALILIFSYRYNKQDAELLENKHFLKQWKHSNYHYNFKAHNRAKSSANGITSIKQKLDIKRCLCFLFNKRSRQPSGDVTLINSYKKEKRRSNKNHVKIPTFTFQRESVSDMDLRTVKFEIDQNDDKCSINSNKTV